MKLNGLFYIRLLMFLSHINRVSYSRVLSEENEVAQTLTKTRQKGGKFSFAITLFFIYKRRFINNTKIRMFLCFKNIF